MQSPALTRSRPPNVALVAAASLALCGTDVTLAGGTLKIDDTKWVSLGAGLRTSYNSVEDASPQGNRSNDFELDSIRLYLNGQIHKNILFTFNTEREADEGIRVLDGIARFEFMPELNIWGGRMLPPSDRSNLSGPYYLGAWNFPLVQAYPAVFAGRDDGASVWGETELGGVQFKYAGGVFQGCTDNNPCNTGANDDNPLWAGRVVLNLWDPEPGYYNASTYFGALDVLALGFAIQGQSDAVGTAANPKGFLGWNMDFLAEKKLGGNGVATLEGAYYSYDLDGALDAGNLYQGDGWFVLAGYMFPQEIGIGKFKPIFRYQDLKSHNVPNENQWELGLDYVIDGHNARVSMVYGQNDTSGLGTNDFFQLGVQLQI
jgi:hypothetical protein